MKASGSASPLDRRNQASLSSLASPVVDMPHALFVPSCEVNQFKTVPTKGSQKLKATFKCPSFADTVYWSDAYIEIAQNCGLAVTTEVLEYEPQMFAGTLRKVQPDILVHVEGTQQAITLLTANLDYGPVSIA
jgi:hypothetical protein